MNKKNNKKRIALGILLGTIGIFGVGLYLRERGKEEKEEKLEKKKEETIARENTDEENVHYSVRALCISILNSKNPPTNPSDFLRQLVILGMFGGTKILEKLPKSINEMEDMLADFKIYREYSRLCYSKLGKIEIKKGTAIKL